MSGARSGAPAWTLSAVELARRYRDGTLDPVAALDDIAARIDAINPALNALVTPDPSARDQARASAQRFARSAPLGSLDGIPVAVKDNLVVAGLRTTWGTRGLAGNLADRDELPVARLRATGAVIVGKTNVPEFTLEGYTANPLFGVTRNPWNLLNTPGGSSGGAVAGCAAGLFPLGLCTDGGGSIRRPAAHTGLVGLKPSIGAIARGGGLPSLLLDLEVVGPIARTVDDAALLFDALRGPDAGDRASLAARPMPQQPRALRVLAVTTLDDAPVDAQIKASFEHATRVVAQLGHSVQRGPLALDLRAVDAFWPIIGQVSLARLFAAQPELRDGASDKYVERAAQGERIGAALFLEGIEAIARFRREAAALFTRIDVVMTPTTAALPWPADEAFPAMIDGKEVGPRGHAIFTGWVNLCGHAAISVPSTPSPSGIPIGVQFVGGYGADDVILDLARAYERVAPWADRRPPI